MEIPVCPVPEHAGSRVVRGGWYGRPPHRRQRWVCRPVNGDPKHRFTPVLTRQGQPHPFCVECSTGLEPWEGQAGAREYRFSAREVGEALVLVGKGRVTAPRPSWRGRKQAAYRTGGGVARRLTKVSWSPTGSTCAAGSSAPGGCLTAGRTRSWWTVRTSGSRAVRTGVVGFTCWRRSDGSSATRAGGRRSRACGGQSPLPARIWQPGSRSSDRWRPRRGDRQRRR